MKKITLKDAIDLANNVYKAAEAGRTQEAAEVGDECCQWDHNPVFLRWETDCEELCVLWNHTDPKRYGFKYCPFCGLEIKWG
jgi:hypothetical protein